MAKQWFEKSYRRSLVDMHIPDWDERFLSQFDSQEYIRLMKLARVESFYIYATSCVGLANFPAKAGNVHKGLAERDVIQEITTAANDQGMNVIVYYNIWSKWAYDHHPEWRVVNAKGQGTADYMWDQPGRYGVCCINSPYREFVKEQLEELCNNYTFDGLWIDMILLPQTICYCSSCRKRYYDETGRSELPRTIDWEDPDFVSFQRRREAWLNDFTAMLTQASKQIKPHISMGYNVSSYSVGWQSGGNVQFFNQNDYLSGDVSSDPLIVTYTCKLFHSSNPKHSIEFMTSVVDSNLLEHTIMKSKEYLRTQLYLTISHNAAFGFIDAIDPIGTLNEKTYAIMGQLFSELIPLEPYLDPASDFCQDVAIYTNFESLVDLRDNTRATKDVDVSVSPHFMASLTAAKSLINANISFGVINSYSMAELDKYQVIILPDLLVISQEEVETFRSFVEKGGSLYASANTSLLDNEGNRHDDFMLAELLGVSYVGKTVENHTYIAPTDKGSFMLPGYSQKYPLTLNSHQHVVRAHESAETLATIVLPEINAANVHQFSSAISSPPEIITTHPAVVANHYGAGKSIYAAGPLELMEKEEQRKSFIQLIKSLLHKPVWFESDAPKPVEITLFHQQENHRFILHAVNIQKELPNIPVDKINIRVKLGDKQPTEVKVLPSNNALPFAHDGQYVEVELPRLDTYLMLVVDYSSD
ncbi:alpha-amylase family protein [Paenibacillus eucommiae]|uniref:Beta-galactosidase trimerisation domain-containing protein n=1 Tax=Paenibacillus eucommiae TaxID=1355755 RepID=A0ABS4J5P8_9BACL|nr:beta-galactosidase trimerization domain-containing protein [Paenibacillus eucommiae]MBP1994576.1 hypothetical protein [Paenibacillus eucommiae]